MSWGTLFFVADETPVRPEFTAPLPSQWAARKEAARLVKRMAAQYRQPRLELLADDLRTGKAKDDTVFFGAIVVAVLDYGEDPQAAVMAWLEDWAAQAGTHADWTQ